MSSTTTRLGAVLVGACLILSSAHASLFTIGATSVVGSSPDLNTPSPTAIIDQSGLSANYVSGVTDFTSFTATTTAAYAFDFTGSMGGTGAPPASLDFDLGAVYSISGLAIWNNWGSASLKKFTIYSSADNTFTSLSNLGTFDIADGFSSTANPANVFSFGAINTQYLKLAVIENYGYSGGTRINEIVFAGESSNSSVPDSGMTILLAGLPILGLIAGHRRRRNAR